jgi:DNA helicase HerA-like ATPase
LDDRIAIVGTAGSGKTYAAKGFVERLLDSGARVAIVDPLGVWWGLRASADGSAPGYPVIVFGGKHADVPITSDMGVALGRIVAREALVCVVDLSDLGSSAARRRFMAAFAEALYETNEEPLHLVLDEADLWAPQRPIKGWEGLLGHIEEIVRRGRVRGFIPWLITQRPAVVHKDVLSQADILIAMKLTASQDRDAIGAFGRDIQLTPRRRIFAPQNFIFNQRTITAYSRRGDDLGAPGYSPAQDGDRPQHPVAPPQAGSRRRPDRSGNPPIRLRLRPRRRSPHSVGHGLLRQRLGSGAPPRYRHAAGFRRQPQLRRQRH